MLTNDRTEGIAEKVRSKAHRIDSDASLDPLMERIGESRLVLLGEASHGTSEYYSWRARISRRLIQEKGFRFIAVEGDWPDCYEVNRYVKGWMDEGTTAYDLLHRFDRWPTWMWANWEIVALAEWLRKHNRQFDDDRKVGFYGLDVYSLWESIEAVLRHIEEKHPQALPQVHRALSCFEPFNRDPQEYGWSTRMIPEDCEDEVIGLLETLRGAPSRYPDDPEAHFDAEQNALVAIDAERYYRTMMRADRESWNVRDTHMADTLDRLLHHYGPGAKGIVWEHNTHVGDARYTDMGRAGMVNVGQLSRERHEADGVMIVGFGSDRGTVIAGTGWGAPMQRMTVPEAKPGSWEQILHDAWGREILLLLDDFRNDERFVATRGHRAIGVVYRPDGERHSNYVPTVLTHRYDAFLFIDQTRALHPLHLTAHAETEPPETYPWGV